MTQTFGRRFVGSLQKGIPQAGTAAVRRPAQGPRAAGRRTWHNDPFGISFRI
jgi:hypothetical protein